MEKRSKGIIIVVAVILVLVVAVVLYFNLTKIEITEGCNLMIKIDWQSAPSMIDTYYFYDDYIIETTYSSGVLPEGVVTNTTTTKYHFSEKINIDELRAYLDRAPKASFDEYRAVQIVEKDGVTYYIDDTNVESDKLTIAHAELLDIIWKITEKASFKQIRTN